MPKTKFARRKTAKKTKKGKYGNKNNVRIGGGAAVISRGITTGFPTVMYAKLVYYTGNLALTPSTTPLFYQMNLNSIYDPDRTGAGHQPMGRDQYAALFGAYRVDRCDYEVNLSNCSTLQPFSYRWGINPLTSGPVAGTGPEAKRWNSGNGGANHSVIAIKGSTDLWTAASVSKARYQTDDVFVGGIGADPATTPTLQVYVAPFDGATSTQIDFNFRMTYHVKFFDPVYLSQS